MKRLLVVAVVVSALGGTLALSAGTGGAATQSASFKNVEAKQTFTVPAGVCGITIDALAANGGGYTGAGESSVPGGKGGSAVATVTVTPGETLTVLVGGPGGDEVFDSGNPVPAGVGGFGGGGHGGDIDLNEGNGGGAGGGGASYVARGSEPLVVAGGGGGVGGVGGDFGVAPGGDGGGAAGQDGTDGGDDTGGVDAGQGGGGGTAAAPGAAGAGGGTLGNDNGLVGAALPDVIVSGDPTGGDGGAGDGGNGGGGGGGGYHGGGGGGGTDIGSPSGGGGGGGTSFALAGATNVTLASGANDDASGDGLVVISWDPDTSTCAAPAAAIVGPIRFTG